MAREDPTSDFLNYDFMHLTVWHAPDVVTCHTQEHYKRVQWHLLALYCIIRSHKQSVWSYYLPKIKKLKIAGS